MGEDVIGPILKSVETTGGGWPVLVLVLFWFSVIGAIVYLARYVLSRQIRIGEQRVAERKQEFEVQLQRERDNASNYQNTTNRMVEAFDKNSAAIAEFSSILRSMSETLYRIDRHLEQPGEYRQRRKGEQ